MARKKYRIGTKVCIKSKKFRGQDPCGKIIGFVGGKYKIQGRYSGIIRYKKAGQIGRRR